MVLWRISRHQDLSGIGGLKANGRWHYSGQRIVYLTESAASAILEVCVHTAANDTPPDYTLLRIEGPKVKIPSIREIDLPKHWQTEVESTREIGTDWLRQNTGVLLQIPSAIVPQTANFLLNPNHSDARKFRIVEALVYPFDIRLKR